MLAYINAVRGIDFSLYRQATVRRKIGLRISETGMAGYEEYLHYLKAHPAEVDSLIKAVTVKFSNFFRNPLVYELLSAQVIPDLASEFRFIKVWSIGCADGEEPYSVAMLLHDLFKPEREHCDVRILGTDINEDSIGKAVRGEYHERELEEVKKKYIDTYFARLSTQGQEEHKYRISNEIKSMVNFACEDIMGMLRAKKARSDHYNLVLCRNVITYMNRGLQDDLFRMITGIIHDRGFLVLGETETIPDSAKGCYVQVFPGVKIFRKKGVPQLNMPAQMP